MKVCFLGQVQISSFFRIHESGSQAAFPNGPQSGPFGAHLGPNFAQLGPNRGPHGMLLVLFVGKHRVSLHTYPVKKCSFESENCINILYALDVKILQLWSSTCR